MKHPVDYAAAYADAYLAMGTQTEDTDCVDADGEVWPEHDFPDVGHECRRCGAEVED